MRVSSGFGGLAGSLARRWLALAAVCAFACNDRSSPPSVIGKTEQARWDDSQLCIAPERPAAAIALAPVFTNLQVSAPIALVQAPRIAANATGRWFLADQHGLVHSFFSDTDSEISKLETLDLTDRVVLNTDGLDERGLLSLALHPNFSTDPRIVISYSGAAGRSTLSTFVVKDGRIDALSEVILLQIAQPYTNHNGGHVVFGSDGYLYAAFGDGGSGGDPAGNGQNSETLLGTIIRIDIDSVDCAQPYAVPADNPFVAGGGAPEIYAMGLRNPWRFSFDREGAELWVGDVGQNEWEEISIVERGGNYGWNTWEAFECYPPEVSDCDAAGVMAPVHSYAQPPGNASRSVTGGFVYRGNALPDLVGNYVFADYVTGEVWKLLKAEGGYVAGQPHTSELLIASGVNVSSFAEDQNGELYILDYGGNRILKLTATSGGETTLPARLSQTGCFGGEHLARHAANVVPYDVRVPFWSDGAEKQRFVALPEGEHLSLNAEGEYELPPGGMTIKTLSLGERLIETRFYVRHQDGEYSGYSYKWRADGTDADLVLDGASVSIGELDWTIPGRTACPQCHTAAAGRNLGLELAQLPQATLTALIEAEIVQEPVASFSRLATLDDEAVSVAIRARAYLDVNCSNCHRPGGPGRGALDLRSETHLSESGLCKQATLGQVGSSNGELLAIGDASDSVLYRRMTRRDEDAMPPLASRVVDTKGAALIAEWIDGLTECP